MSTRREKKPARKADRGSALAIRFEAALQAAGERTIIRVPGTSSSKLPSRGQVAVTGAINGQPFETVIEPDGDFGHWMNIERRLEEDAGIGPGDQVTVELEPSREWPEPSVPPDLQNALAEAPVEVRQLWQAITPMARWEWVRWINATRNPATRERRVAVSLSKLREGKRRPCCFNLAGCTDPELSRSGKLVVD